VHILIPKLSNAYKTKVIRSEVEKGTLHVSSKCHLIG